jgi:predicted transcriptional regulator
MMHRPKDNAFVPVLGVAYIAMQMVSKYLLVKNELQIKPENILNCDSQLHIIEALWSKSPQTCKELYQLENFNQKYTYKKLETEINILVDQNLVKVKRLENDEIQYFPALNRSALHTTLERGRKDSLNTISQISQIDSLLIYFGNPSR